MSEVYVVGDSVSQIKKMILIVNLIPQTMEEKGSRFSLLFLNPSQMDDIAKYS